MAIRFSPVVEEALAQSAARYGLPLSSMRVIAQLESGGNPNARNPNSSAGGVFQFIDSTAKQYGLKNKFDPYQSADAGARLLRDNMAGLTKALGRQPTTGELYLAHQQGLGGAIKLLSNPNAPASSLVGGKAVSLNAGDPNMTASQFAARWVNKANSLDGNGQIMTGTGQPIVSPQAAEQAGIASLAPTSVAGLPTVGEVAATDAGAVAADPIAGIFGLLAQGQQQQQPVPVVQTIRKPKDTRPLEEKVASTSMTPDAYLERNRRKYFG